MIGTFTEPPLLFDDERDMPLHAVDMLLYESRAWGGGGGCYAPVHVPAEWLTVDVLFYLMNIN